MKLSSVILFYEDIFDKNFLFYFFLVVCNKFKIFLKILGPKSSENVK